MHAHTYTYIDACIHTNVHAHIDLHSLACFHAYTHKPMHTYTHSYTSACMHAWAHIHLHACTHTYTCTHICIHTCTQTHIYMHVHTNRHAHTYLHACIHTHVHACTVVHAAQKHARGRGSIWLGGGCQRSTGSHVTGIRSKVKVMVIQDGAPQLGRHHGNSGCFLSNPLAM